MSNVFFSIAIRSCCEARTIPKHGLLQLLGNIRSFRTSRNTSLLNIVPRKDFPTPRTCTRVERRPLSATATLDDKKGGRKTHLQPRARSAQSQPRARSAQPRPVAGSAQPQPVIESAQSQLGTSGAKVEPATTQATHTEGVLDTESWRDYDPAGGLPLPSGELSQSDIESIFGPESDVDNGNYILSVLHWRRMSGALIDVGIDFPKLAKISHTQALQGLAYLRRRYPDVNEEELGLRWVEEESEKMSQELQARAVKLRLYKPIEPEEEDAEEEETTAEEGGQGKALDRPHDESSAAEGFFRALRTRAANKEAQRVINIAMKERSLLHAARGPLELAGGVQPSTGAVKRYGTFAVVLREPDAVATLRPIERKPWVQYYEEKALVTKENSVPQISTIRRLLPSFLVMLLTIAFCLYLSENYTPPPTEARLFPSIPPSVATVAGLTAVMFGIFCLSRLPFMWRINNKYFCVVPAYPFALSNIGAIFRHDNFFHWSANVLTLWFVGFNLHENVGRGTFLAIFLGSGVVGTYLTLVYNVLQKRWITYIFGASGAVFGLVAALCTIRPNGVVSAFGYELPFAAWLWLAMLGTVEVAAVLRGRLSSVDHVGHIGGMIGGLAAAAYLRRKWSKMSDQAPVMEPISGR